MVGITDFLCSSLSARPRVLPSPLITSQKWTSLTPQALAMDHASPATPPNSSSTPIYRPYCNGSTDSCESSLPTSSGSNTTASPSSTTESPPPSTIGDTTSSPSPHLLPASAESDQHCFPASPAPTCVQPTMSLMPLKSSSQENELKGSRPLDTRTKLSVGSSSSLKDVLVMVERLSHLSLKDSHEGSLPGSSPKNPPLASDAEVGKENAVPQEVSTLLHITHVAHMVMQSHHQAALMSPNETKQLYWSAISRKTSTHSLVMFTCTRVHACSLQDSARSQLSHMYCDALQWISL